MAKRKRQVKRPNQWLTPENAKKVSNFLGASKKIYNNFREGSDAVKGIKKYLKPGRPSKPKSAIKNAVSVRRENMNGGGNVVCTHINVGRSTAKARKLISDYKKHGAWGSSQFLQSFIVQNTNVTAYNQIISVLGSIFKGAAINTLLTEAYDSNAAWQALAPGLLTANYEGDILCSYAKVELEFTNMEQAITFVDLYTLRAKKDNESPYTYDDPKTCWSQAYSEVAGLNTIDQNFPGCEPGYPFFNDNFHKVNHETICMNPGEVRRITVYFKLNKQINISRTAGHQGNLRGLTHHIMMVARGSPVDNSTTQFSVPTEFYLSPIKIVGTITTSYSLGVRNRPGKVRFTSIAGMTSTYGANVYVMRDENAIPADMKAAGSVG